jgi:predicted ATPase
MVKVKSIVIQKFRHFVPNEEFMIGDRITLIAGQNGTAKSTLLGMICQPLGFPDPTQGKQRKADSLYTRVYDGLKLWEYPTLAGRSFKAIYSDVFRMSKRYDNPREHEYTLHIKGDDGDIEIGSGVEQNGLKVRSEGRQGGLRFVTNSESRKPGEGNYPHPVIYLGLERLRPLATCLSKDIISNKHLILPDDNTYFITTRNEIFVEKLHPEMKSERVDTGRFKNSYFSTQTTTYDGESASAGQDNLGQILTAIRSFHQLKNKLAEKYRGGMLLIDEIDSTLHPVAQLNLLKHLVAQSKELDLQVVATTHSLFLLEKACRQLKSDVTLVYLKKKDNAVKVYNDITYDSIITDLTATLNPKEKDKTTVLFEDHIAAGFFKRVTKNIFRDYVNIYNTEETNHKTSFSNQVHEVLATIAKKKIPEFQKMVFVMDGDSKHKEKKDCKNLLAMPGGMAIEKCMYFFLHKTEANDELWDKLENGFTWQVCFNGFDNLRKENSIDNFKKWFAVHSKAKHFGSKENSRLYEQWVKNNEQECKKFSLRFLEALRIANSRARVNLNMLKEMIDKKFNG